MGISPHRVSGVNQGGPAVSRGASAPGGFGRDLCKVRPSDDYLGEPRGVGGHRRWVSERLRRSLGSAKPLLPALGVLSAGRFRGRPEPLANPPRAHPPADLGPDWGTGPYPHGESNPGYHLERVMS
jgi:hypothetical protein